MDVKFKEIKYVKKFVDQSKTPPKKFEDKFYDASLVDVYLKKNIKQNPKFNDIRVNKLSPSRDNENEIKNLTLNLKNNLPESTKKSTLKKDLMIKKLLEKKNNKSNSLANLSNLNETNMKNKKFNFEAPTNIFFKFDKNEKPLIHKNSCENILNSIKTKEFEFKNKKLNNSIINFHKFSDSDYLYNYIAKKNLEKSSERSNSNIKNDDKSKLSAKNTSNKFQLYDEYSTMNKINIEIVDNKYKTFLNKNKNWKNFDKNISSDQGYSNEEENEGGEQENLEEMENGTPDSHKNPIVLHKSKANANADPQSIPKPNVTAVKFKNKKFSNNFSIVKFEASKLNSIPTMGETKKFNLTSTKRKISCTKSDISNSKNKIIFKKIANYPLSKNEFRGKHLKPIDASRIIVKSRDNIKDDKSKNISKIFNNINNVFIKKSLARSINSRNFDKINIPLKKSFSISDEDVIDKCQFNIKNKRFSESHSTLSMNTETNRDSTIDNLFSDNVSSIFNQGAEINIINDKVTILTKFRD